MASQHELYLGQLYLDQGECVYLRRDVADHPDANHRLLAIFHSRMGRNRAR